MNGDSRCSARAEHANGLESPPRLGAAQRLVVAEILLGHPSGRKPLLEGGADSAPVETTYALDRRDGLVLAVHDESGDTIVDHFRDRAPPIGNHRRTTGHRLDHDQSERLGPVNREEERQSTPEEVTL